LVDGRPQVVLTLNRSLPGRVGIGRPIDDNRETVARYTPRGENNSVAAERK
jgi:hypothetical protein